MSQGIRALRKLLQGAEAPEKGTIAYIKGNEIRVNTSKGLIKAYNNSGSSLKKDDEVQLNGTSIVALLFTTSNLPVYYV